MLSLRLSSEEYGKMFGKQKKEKYRNVRCSWMGIKFQSKRERDRFIILDAALRDGEITGLQRQVKYQLLPKQYINGRLVEREICYKADFVYYDKNGHLVVEDAKGFRRNAAYIQKRKMMLWFHGIQVKEV